MALHRIARLSVLFAAVMFSLSGAAVAQRNTYGYDRDNQNSNGRNVAGEFDYYALVLSWSPTHCATVQDSRDDQQCNRRDGRRYAFVLHGLWPQYERSFPGDCRTAKRPFVPRDVINGMLDVMPSSGLIIHEYRKHGTCSGLEPIPYFSLARRLYESIRVPHRYENPFDTQFVSPEDLVEEFVKENEFLKPDMIAVACGGSGNRLKEIRICMTRDGRPRTCGHNENQRRMCSARSMYVPPVRSTGAPDTGRHPPRAPSDDNRNNSPLPGPPDTLPNDRNNNSPLPGPRLIPSPGSP